MSTTTHPSRAVVHQLASERAHAQLPLTFLGTFGDNRHPLEQGWQPHMWSHHAFVSGAVYAAAIAVHTAVEKGVLPAPGLSWGYAGAAAGLSLTGLAVAAGGLIATAGERFCDWARAYFFATPAAAGAYLTAVSVTSPFSTPGLVAAAAGTAIGMGMYYQMRTSQDAYELKYVARFASIPTQSKPKATPPSAPVPIPTLIGEQDESLRQWSTALHQVGLKGCRALRKVDTAAGYAILIELPASGKISPEQVGTHLPALERNMGMLRDCLEFDVATTPDGREKSNRCWIIVDVEDVLSQLLEMPDGDDVHEPTSVHEAFRIGTFMDGTPMTMTMREISALIVGVRGRGKTNLFHVIVHQLSRCNDVVLWAIDLKGGRAVKPWLKPWLDEEVARPVFDWVATTRAEATLMNHAMQALIKHRGNASHGGSKLEPSPEHPAVIILVDELAALVGKHAGPKLSAKGRDWWKNPSAQQAAATITSNIQLGRSEAGDYVLFTQRGTVTMTGGGDLKSQCELRVGLGVTNPSDATSVFQNNAVAAKKLRKLKDQRTRGACLIENGIDPNHLAGKVYFYGDDQQMLNRIYKAATRHAMYPADLPLLEQQAIEDALLALTSGECGYGVGPDAAGDQRWSLDRAEHLYTEGLAPDWTDEDPSDGTSLGGQNIPTSGAPTSGATATITRPRTVRPASGPPADIPEPPPRQGPYAPTYNRDSGIPTSPGHPALDDETTGSRYYKRRADRAPGEPAVPPTTDMDPEARHYQAEFNEYVRFLTDAPDADEPAYDTTDPDQQSRYDTMLQIIEAAGATGIMPGEITKQMIKSGRAWAKRTQMYPALKRATAAGKITQPWERGPYYWHAYAPKRVA